MAVKRNTKLILAGALILVLIVGCSVAVARAVIEDTIYNNDGGYTEYSTERVLKDVRALMNDTTVVGLPIQAYIIPSVDAHLNEYIAGRDNRMAFVSGFTGSAGTVVIAEQVAALWTDSRYFLQAEEQLNAAYWTLMKSGLPDVPTYINWLKDTLPPNSRIGIDPFLISAQEFQKLSAELHASGHTAVAIPINIVDAAWKNRPALKLNALEPLEFRFSGKRASEKVEQVREQIRKMGTESHIISSLDSIAWLLNLRGTDIEHNPVFYAYVILTQNEIQLYLLKEDRITVRIQNHFSQENIDVIVREYNNTLAGINNVIRSTTGKMLLSACSEAINAAVPAERRHVAESPIIMLKVVKNEVEAKGIRHAHIRDGVAVIKYLHWLEQVVDDGNVTELSGAAKLLQFRSEQEYFKGLSFGTISAVGAHAALVHYFSTPQTNVKITRDEIYLVDSGGQYLDGTTDITRTIHLGTPKPKEIDTFTRVLKGSINMGTAVFPRNAPYSFFDAMARRSLWDVGLDYGHGTGHGIGAYLNVHEYPPLISSGYNIHGMIENMFMSNEPGYYEAAKFGIRIENIVQVVPAPEVQFDFNGKGAFKLFDITSVPIQRKLIDLRMLNQREVDWLNDFHHRIRENVSPLLQNEPQVLKWLIEQTEPIVLKETNGRDDPICENTIPL